MDVYTLLGVVFSIYVTVATYRCAGNCQSKFLARFVRLSTIISVVVVLPVLAYLYFTGALSLALMGEQ
jgi:ABC-type amino acid transport system permease subunit